MALAPAVMADVCDDARERYISSTDLARAWESSSLLRRRAQVHQLAATTLIIMGSHLQPSVC